jgi:hypothetical protein
MVAPHGERAAIQRPRAQRRVGAMQRGHRRGLRDRRVGQHPERADDHAAKHDALKDAARAEHQQLL